jgi:hypothetical protein
VRSPRASDARLETRATRARASVVVVVDVVIAIAIGAAE